MVVVLNESKHKIIYKLEPDVINYIYPVPGDGKDSGFVVGSNQRSRMEMALSEMGGYCRL